jgi:succinate dehydrogenase / fumarate reductase membrane anchor subunit
LGLIVVVEDYVHEAGGRLVWLALIKFAAAFAAALAAFCVLKIALGGAAG